MPIHTVPEPKSYKEDYLPMVGEIVYNYNRCSINLPFMIVGNGINYCKDLTYLIHDIHIYPNMKNLKEFKRENNSIYFKRLDNIEVWVELDDENNVIYYRDSFDNHVFDKRKKKQIKRKVETNKRGEIVSIEEYDEYGRLIYNNDAGLCTKYSYYNCPGNPEHNKLAREESGFNDECSFIEEYEYDENGYLIKIKNSRKKETIYKYDENGNEIYFKDSNGAEIWKTYDEYGVINHITRNDGFEYSREVEYYE